MVGNAQKSVLHIVLSMLTYKLCQSIQPQEVNDNVFVEIMLATTLYGFQTVIVVPTYSKYHTKRVVQFVFVNVSNGQSEYRVT